jgi:hypothetical protein
VETSLEGNTGLLGTRERSDSIRRWWWARGQTCPGSAPTGKGEVTRDGDVGGSRSVWLGTATKKAARETVCGSGGNGRWRVSRPVGGDREARRSAGVSGNVQDAQVRGGKERESASTHQGRHTLEVVRTGNSPASRMLVRTLESRN